LSTTGRLPRRRDDASSSKVGYRRSDLGGLDPDVSRNWDDRHVRLLPVTRLGGLAHLHGQHGDGPSIDALYRERDVFALLPGAQYVKQRQVVVRRRNG